MLNDRPPRTPLNLITESLIFDFCFPSPAFLTHISSILITVVTFAAYTLINDGDIEFNSANVFAALALFNQLTVPLFIFPITIPIIISCLISTRRIERFLSQPEVAKEFEGVRHMARILCKSREFLDEDDDHPSHDGDKRQQISNKLFMEEAIDKEELDEKLLMEIKINDREAKILADDENENDKSESLENLNGSQDDAVVLRNKNNKIKLRKQNQLNSSTRLERSRLRGATAAEEGPKALGHPPPFKVPEEIVVAIRDAKFAWDTKTDANCLEIDRIDIPKGLSLSLNAILPGKLT